MSPHLQKHFLSRGHAKNKLINDTANLKSWVRALRKLGRQANKERVLQFRKDSGRMYLLISEIGTESKLRMTEGNL